MPPGAAASPAPGPTTDSINETRPGRNAPNPSRGNHPYTRKSGPGATPQVHPGQPPRAGRSTPSRSGRSHHAGHPSSPSFPRKRESRTPQAHPGQPPATRGPGAAPPAVPGAATTPGDRPTVIPAKAGIQNAPSPSGATTRHARAKRNTPSRSGRSHHAGRPPSPSFPQKRESRTPQAHPGQPPITRGPGAAPPPFRAQPPRRATALPVIPAKAGSRASQTHPGQPPATRGPGATPQPLRAQPPRRAPALPSFPRKRESRAPQEPHPGQLQPDYFPTI